MPEKKLIQLIIASLMVGCLSVSGAQNTSFEEEDKPRWFEIEVIVYKSSNNQGLQDESWDTNIELTKAANLIDFLQPYYVVSGLYEGGISPTTDLEMFETQIDTTTSSVGDIHRLDEEAKLLAQLNQTESNLPVEEKPFTLLDKELLQLNDIASSLKRHPDYKVLTHIAWRQPVLGRQDATHIRIAGGQDFSEFYDFEGNKLMPVSEISEDRLAGNQLNVTIEQVDENSRLIFENQSENRQPLLQNIEPLAWVPELDGDIKIYLKKFLHVRTNLFLRRPDKEEIEVVDLERYDLEMLSIFSSTNILEHPYETRLFSSDKQVNSDLGLFGRTNKMETNELMSLNKEAKHLSLQSTNYSNQASHQFSWEIEDDFLDRQSQKMYLERLFNYPLKQSRRVRSGELHFFDHPLLGILIIIRPYELQKDPLQEEFILQN